MTGGAELLQQEELPKIQEEPCKGEDGVESEQNVTFTINEEDHTLGNVLRFVLAKYPETEFVGYTIPHPTQHRIILRVQARPGHTAKELLIRALKDAKLIFETMKGSFGEAYLRHCEVNDSS